jgi:aryl-alcohol dehydrogenase-like predicted oxidoreductase
MRPKKDFSMQTRTLGSTGIAVPIVGFGGWQLGNATDFGPMDDAAAARLVHAALDAGCNYFDTAPNYGRGASETLLGKALAGRRAGVVISSKVGHHSDGTLSFEPERIAASVEQSLGRLKTDYLDVLLLHNPPFELLAGHNPHYEVLRKLKAAGKIRAYGASLDWSREIRELLATTDCQVIEILLNIFHQDPAAAFDLVREKNVGLIAKVPLDSGWLAGKYTAASRFTGIRSRWSPETIERRAGLVDQIRFVTDDGSTLVQAALRFIQAWPEVATVIPGVRSIAQLEENLSAAARPMPPETAQRLRSLWAAELKDNPLPW